MKTKEEILLEMDISNILLDFAYTDKEAMTTSDYQGQAQKYAIDIISLIKNTK